MVFRQFIQKRDHILAPATNAAPLAMMRADTAFIMASLGYKKFGPESIPSVPTSV